MYSEFEIMITTKNYSETITKSEGHAETITRKKVTPLNDLNFGEFLVNDKNAPVFEPYIKS